MGLLLFSLNLFSLSRLNMEYNNQRIYVFSTFINLVSIESISIDTSFFKVLLIAISLVESANDLTWITKRRAWLEHRLD